MKGLYNSALFELTNLFAPHISVPGRKLALDFDRALQGIEGARKFG
jgi:hypothetical protein